MTAAKPRDLRTVQLQSTDWAASAGGVWASADALWAHMCAQTNHVRAASAFDWHGLLPDAAVVLDLGCGPGWLTAQISAQPAVARVLAWDSSPYLLEHVLPRMVELAGGRPDRIEPTCGEFVPLLLDDDAVHVAVMSSAFHHAEDPDALLAEIARVLAPGGTLVLLNETPWHPLRLLAFATRHYLAAVLGLAGLPRPRAVGALIPDGAIYDPVLGDRAYTMRGWRAIAERNGWSLALRDSGLAPYPRHERRRALLEPNLHHLVLRPAARSAARSAR